MTQFKSRLFDYCQGIISDDSVRQWYAQKVQNIQSGSGFHLAFGMVPRKVGKTQIPITGDIIELLSDINPDADQVAWTLDEWCRMVLLLHLPHEGRFETIQSLISAADSREARVIYKSIQYLEKPEEFELSIVDGIRTNMIDVFDSIALHNIFPSRYFKESAWNQMVLKGIFMERPIYHILDLDRRRNADLARIAVDFAHERWSAGRKVTPELWRLVVPFVDDVILEDLKKVVSEGDELEKESGIKALTECTFPKAHSWLESVKHEGTTKDWNEIGEAILKMN